MPKCPLMIFVPSMLCGNSYHPLLSYQNPPERQFLLGPLFYMKTFCSDGPYLIRNHLPFCSYALF